MKRAITFSTDANYIKYTRALVNSLYSKGVDGDIICRCVDFTNEQLASLNDLHITIIDDQKNLSQKKSILKDTDASIYHHYGASIKNNIKGLRDLLYSPRSVYTCHSRFHTIPDLLSQQYDTIICLDVDTIINRNIDCLYDMIIGHDLLTIVSEFEPGDVIEYGGLRPVTNNTDKIMRCLFSEGFLVINNTPISVEFWNEVAKEINESWESWNRDSEVINNLLNTEYINLDILSVGDIFKDGECQEDAYMWSGESVTKSNPRFISAVNSYQ